MPQFDRITPVSVAVRAQRGHVDVTAAEGAAVEVDITPLDKTEAGAEAARSTQVALDGDTLYVQTPSLSAWQWRRSPRLAITVRVPAGSALAAKTASADVRAAGRYSVAEIDLASGDAWVEQVDGDAYLKTASGDLTAVRIGGGLRIGTASGDLKVGDVAGDVKADTASGDITIRTVGGSVKATTASGDIEVGMVRRGVADLRTASGDVEVGVAAGTGVWLDVNTYSGTTRNDLTMGGGGDDDGGGEGSRQAATLELRVRTASGDVSIRRIAVDPSPAV